MRDEPEKQFYTLRLVNKGFRYIIDNSVDINYGANIHIKNNINDFNKLKNYIEITSLNLSELNNFTFAITLTKCMKFFTGKINCYTEGWTPYLKMINQDMILRNILKNYLKKNSCNIDIIENLLDNISDNLVLNSAYLLIILQNPPLKIAQFYLKKINIRDYKYLGELNIYISSTESNGNTPDENHMRDIIDVYRYHKYVEDIVQFALNKEFTKAFEYINLAYYKRLDSDEI